MGSLADADRADLLEWVDRNVREQNAVIDAFIELLGPTERAAIAPVDARRRVWTNAEALLRSVPSDRVEGALTVLELWSAAAGEGSPNGATYRAIAQRLRERVCGTSDGG